MPEEVLASSQEVQQHDPILAIENESQTIDTKTTPLPSHRYTADKHSEEQMRKIAGAY